MTRRIVIRDWLPEPLANGSHGHWSQRQKKLKAAQTMVWATAQHEGLEPVRPDQRARLTITLVFPVARRRDVDNLHSRVKGCIDGLVYGGWLVDDSTAHVDLIVRAEVEKGCKRLEMVLEPIP